MIRDCLHQDILIDDWVAFNPPVYKGMCIGKVIKLTPKGVSVKYGKDLNEVCNRHSSDVIKITQQRKFAMNLNPELFI